MEIENEQEFVPVDVNLNDSEVENIDNQSNIRALRNSSIFSDQLTKILGALLQSSILKIYSTHTGATLNGVLIYTMGTNKIKIKDNVYEFTDEIHKALSSTGCCGKTMKKDSDFLMLKKKLI